MIEKTEAQITWAASGYYTGGIDGLIGLKSRRAMSQIQLEAKISARWSQKRRFVATVQWCLNRLGHDAGAVDGYAGHNTRNALDALLFKLANGGKAEVVARDPQPYRPAQASPLPRQSEMGAFYGDPETEVPHRLVTIELPFQLRIDWNLRQRTNKMTVHRECGPSLHAAMVEVHDTYGEAEWRRLGLDRYAGGYNKRRMRGGRKWSTHAYGCATDFNAQPNGLRTRCPEALFCKPEYKAFLDIMESHGWLPAIRLWGADAMHFQRARL